MTDPSGLPTTLTTSYPTTSAASVGYMMMSYPGQPPMVPMQPSVGMQYMPIGAAGPPIMPTIMPMPPLMGHPSGMVSSTIQQPPFRNQQRARKPNLSGKPQLIVKPPSVTISAPSTTNTSMAQDIPKGPPVTVFVGNITEKAPDVMIRQILSSCGHVMSWKRVQAFGFCEFGNPDAALRAHRLLHEMEIGFRKLVVRVDAKTQDVLDEYKAEKRKNKKPDSFKNDALDDEDYIDADMRIADENAKKRIHDILQEYKDQMQKYNPPSGDDDKPKTGAEVTEARVQQTQQRLLQLTKSSASSNHLHMKIDLDTVEYAEDGKRDLISREIGKFREIMKKQEEEKELERKKREEREKERDRAHSPHSPSTNGRGRSQSYQSISSTRSISPDNARPAASNRSRDRSRSRDRDRRNVDRSRERERDREHRDRDRERNRDKDQDRDRERDRNRDRDRVRDRDRNHDRPNVDRDRDRNRAADRDRERERDRDRDRDHERSPRDRDERPGGKVLISDKEEEEEQKEQRKRERAAREREASYQERLKTWETREKFKARETTKEKEKKRAKEEEKQKEAKLLKEFLEDYDDERDDTKYYRGRELQRKLTDRELEIEMDNRDRQKEKEELEELKAKIFSSDSNNPEFEFAKLLKAREELYKPKLLINVTEEQHSQRKKFHSREKDGEKERRRERDEWDREQPPHYSQKRVAEQRRASSVDDDDKAAAASSEQTAPQAQPPLPSSLSPAPPLPPSSSSSSSRHNDSAAAVADLGDEKRSVDGDGDRDDDDDGGGGGGSEHQPTYNRSLSSSPAPMPVPSPENYGTPLPIPAPVPPSEPANSQSDDKTEDSVDTNEKDKKKKRKLDVKDVFNNDDDESLQPKQKRKLVPIDYDDKKLKEGKNETPKSQEEKRQHIKTLIDKIPTDKSSLFKYALDWSSVDNNLMEKRIRPWINKKIIEYIGEPEPTLVDFICSKVLAGSEPQSILNDVQMVLDEEAEVFVVKMWRLLIYEVEAKKLGLMK